MELNNKLYNEILNLCEEGDCLVENLNFDKAIKKYLEALNLVPEPKMNWECSTWIYTALGDTYYIKKDYGKAKHFLYNALNCPDGFTNPFILLRLGESLSEIGENEKAKNFLLEAYMLEGKNIFEEEDDKYFNIIKNII